MAARARHRHAADRQPAGGAGRRLHRLARRRHRWPRPCADALARGAAACLVEHEGVEAFAFAGAHIAALPASRPPPGLIAAEWFGRPSERLQVLAVTGTNGKTSTAWWLAHALSMAISKSCQRLLHAPWWALWALACRRRLESTGMTTPDPVLLQQAFRQFVDAGVRACAIEASSIGLAEHRLAGTRIPWPCSPTSRRTTWTTTAAWQAYWQAKAALFDWPGLQAAVVNIDDAQGAALAALAGARAGPVERVHARPARGCRPRTSAMTAQRPALHGGGRGRRALPLQTALIGQYNVSNLLGVIAAHARAGRAAGAAPCGLCAQLLPRARPHGANCRACRPAAGGRGLRPHARRAGKGAARCARWRGHGVASSGACSAAAATAMPASAR